MKQFPRSFGRPISIGVYNYQTGVASVGSFWRCQLSRITLVVLTLAVLITATNLTVGALVHYQPNAAALTAPSSSLQKNQPNGQPAAFSSLSPQLQSVLDKWEASHTANKWSVVVWGLDDNSVSASINANKVFDSASLYKLLLTYPLFKYYTLDSLENSFVMPEGGTPQSMKDCAEIMLRLSDNPCGLAMADRLGLARSQILLTRLGLVHTNINRAAGPVTTADDMALFMQKFYTGQLFNLKTRDYLMGIMQQQIFSDGIPTGCPDCKVADKIGDLQGVRHDIGIVQYKGGAYILAILTNGASYKQIAGLTSQIQSAMTGATR